MTNNNCECGGKFEHVEDVVVYDQDAIRIKPMTKSLQQCPNCSKIRTYAI